MRYVSTRGQSPDATFADALLNGLAPDGGLYMPVTWPDLTPDEIAGAGTRPYAETARRVLSLYAGDSLPAAAIGAAAQRMTAFDHPDVTPLVELEPGLFLLELFHGPTAAFKDLAMQMMAPLIEAALAALDERMLLLTATSGDTGAAAAAAFAGAARVRLVIFHPQCRVSPVQRRQMTTTGADNVLALAVRGDFDDCQRLVKLLLADEGLRRDRRVSSVNSINWGRLAGQIPYYLASAAKVPVPARFVVPTGNFGDAFAGIAAKRMGMTMGPMTAALNANDTLKRALDTGRYERKTAVETASVSMDVAAPSNFERMVFEASGRNAERTRNLFGVFAERGGVYLPPDILGAVRGEVNALRVDDATTAREIARAYKAYGRVICPHTAVALHAARALPRGGPVIALSTAHAAKFPEFVKQALGFEPEAPDRLRVVMDKPERLEVIDASVEAARAAVL
ncbi:MAG TPA: threonine synthase [Caulobacteraceae bacterium]|jgi:threonine synthase|nr:threonine synthase [Caulobacteraceae bacterium]